MAEPQGTIVTMSPTGEAASAPLAAETSLQSPPEAQKDAPNTSQETPATAEEPAPISSVNATFNAGGEAATKRGGLVVHHLNNSRSQRLLWLLEELEVPYDIKKYERNEEMRAPKELRDVHPLGKSPIITDGDITIAESGAITEYIISNYGEDFRPTEAGKIDDLYFTHYAEGSIMPILVNKLIFSIIPQKSPALIRPLLKPVFAMIEKKMLVPELKAHCALIEFHLEESKTGWLAGGEYPTSADFMMAFPVELLALRAATFIGPKTKEYIERIHKRPAYKRGIEKGGKYDLARI